MVILYDPDSIFHMRWSTQFAAKDRLNRRAVPLSGKLPPERIRDVIVSAAQHSGANNEIIFAVGHGGATDLAEGTVDLAPKRAMRLARGNQPPIFIDPFYDWVFPHAGLKPMSDKQQDEEWRSQNVPEKAGATRRLSRWAIYQSIGAAMKANHIYRVTFLSCRIGNARDFIKKIAIDWDVQIRAYLKFVWFRLDGKTRRAQVFLDGDEAHASEDMPATDFITVARPLTLMELAQSAFDTAKADYDQAKADIKKVDEILRQRARTR
jgi:hypothetical protein